MPVADRTTLNNLTPNLDIGDVADPALRLAFFQYITNLIDANYAEQQALITSGTLSPVPPDSLYRQALINAGLEVAQRITPLGSSTLATATSAYVVDRVKSVNGGSGANATVSQVAVADLDGAGNGLKIVHAATPVTGGKLAHVYTVEAKDSYKLAGKQVVYALKVQGVGGMDKLTINARYKTSESAIASTDTLVLSTGPIAINNLSWQTIPLVVTLPIRATLLTTGVIGFEIVGSKSTAEASGDGFIISELELIRSGTDLGFNPRTYAEELALCMRFYEKSYAYGVAPATAVSGPNIELKVVPGTTIANQQNYGKVSYKVKKRTTPTVTVYPYTTPTNTGRVSSADGTDFAASSGTVLLGGDDGFIVQNGSGGTLTASANAIMFHWASDIEL